MCLSFLEAYKALVLAAFRMSARKVASPSCEPDEVRGSRVSVKPRATLAKEVTGVSIGQQRGLALPL